jgi:large subunit ribosomal protein L10
MRRSVSGLHAGATPLDGVYGPDPSSTLVGGTMDNPRPDKVAVVNEVRDRLEAADGAVLTEYRGLTVAELAALRSELAQAGGDYKVYKNTLVRLAVADGPQAELRDLLTGPTAIAFVQGDVSAVAKALRDFSRTNPNLVVKGGVVGSGLLSASDINVLADLPSRDTLLAQFAGALAAPLQQLAGLMQALPRNLAYGISALVDQRQAGGETLETPAEAEAPAPAEAEAPAADAPAAEAPAPAEAEAPAADAPAAEAPAPAEAEAPAPAEAEASGEPEAAE